MQKVYATQDDNIMREIKFRAWDDKYKVMLCTGFNIVGEVTLFNGVEIMLDEQSKKHNDKTPSLLRLNDLVISQFIGVKDTKGNEVYEDDICRILYTDWPSNTDPDIPLEDFLISISHVGRVVYEAPAFGIVLKNRYDEEFVSHFNYGNHGRLEVIGNIYEHSHLLTPPKKEA